MNERRSKKKKKRMESLRLRKTGVKDKHLYGGGAVSPCRRAVFAACLSPLYLEHQPHQQEDKTKQKKKKKKSSTLPFLFKTKHAAGAHGRRLKCGTVILIEFLGLLFSPSFSAALGCPGNLQIGFYSASHPVEVRGRGGSER